MNRATVQSESRGESTAALKFAMGFTLIGTHGLGSVLGVNRRRLFQPRLDVVEQILIRPLAKPGQLGCLLKLTTAG